MTYESILLGALLLLLAFGVEHMARVTGIPSVVALIVIGAVAKPLLHAAGVGLTDLDGVVPLLGTVGLVLIVLEGAFDLRLQKDSLRCVGQALASAALGLLLSCVALALLAMWWFKFSAFEAILLATPFAVISSAVAIPSSGFMAAAQREFVIYESTLSDILGILLFFAMVNSDHTVSGVAMSLLGKGSLSLILGMVCALLLLVILSKLQGRIRFVPLLAGLFLLYAIGKLMHLSPLIMVLVFGLVLSNPILFGRLHLFKSIYADAGFYSTLAEFKSLTIELTFAVRGIFFMLLGYWTKLNSLLSTHAWVAACLVLVTLYGLRYLLMTCLHIHSPKVLTWMAPRGLITVLLYLNAKDLVSVPAQLDGAVMLIVMSTALATGLARWFGFKEKLAQPGAA